MASAVVASRNETTSFYNHQQKKKSNSNNNNNLMGKSPFSNPNPNRTDVSHNYYNPSSKKQVSNRINNNGGVSELKSNDSTSISFSRCVSFNISSLSKSELRELKSRFISELDKVRTLSNKIESKKRLSPFQETNGNIKKQRQVAQPSKDYVASAAVMKMCATVLKKLSSQKAGAWFTSPVDAVGMGLHDYHTVIDRPMDLGTIKGNLDSGRYDTPEEFADDVRLTFNNALRYNPKGHEVNTFAGQYLALFERWLIPILAKFDTEKQAHFNQSRKVVSDENVLVVDDLSKPLNPVKTPSPKPATPPPLPAPVAIPEPEPVPAPVQVSPVSVPVAERSGVRGRKGEGKLPKPKAKDPNKREMSMAEKRKLGNGLQDLPEEKMVQVIQIIRKRNGDLTQDGDEIELDIEAVDKETLWELDRFVTNYNKLVSKIKRQALMGLPGNNVGHSDDTNQVDISERMVENSMKARKTGGDVGEEDVDIGDEMPVNNFPPVEIEKDDDSGSSGSDDSSSSDSDSGSSSGSDSDIDDAQSRDNESKNFHH